MNAFFMMLEKNDGNVIQEGGIPGVINLKTEIVEHNAD